MDDLELSKLYRIRFPEAHLERKNAIWKVLCENFIQRFIDPSDTVVDIACGYGEFINNIKSHERIAIDLNPDSKVHLEEDITFYHRDVLELSDFLDKKVDIIFSSNFLEHLADKPTLEKLLEQIYESLKPGGKYIVMGPNLHYLPAKYWDFYDHHLGLSHLSLGEILQIKGFKLTRSIARFLPFTTRSMLPTHPFFVRCYLYFPPLWRLMGKQFFIIAQKPL
jgi:SAM-dependent methyltransferase